MGHKFADRYIVKPDGTVEPTALQHVGCTRDARMAYNAFVRDNGKNARDWQDDGGTARHEAVLARHAGRPERCNRPGVMRGDLCGDCIRANEYIAAKVAPAPVKVPSDDGGDMARLSAGAFRTVFRRPGGKFVYKVSHYKARAGAPVKRDNKYNEGEYRRLTDERDLGHTWATPVGIYYVEGIAVLAMPYVPQGGDACKPGERDKVRHLPDMHGNNYRATASGRIRVTDLGPVDWG